MLVFIAQQTVEKGSNPDLMNNLFALHTWQSPLFKPWQFVTHLFMHGSIGHIFSNMFALWMFGSVLENLWGPKRFLTFYLICGLGAALMHMTVLYFETNSLLENYNALIQHFNFDNFQNFYTKEHIGDYYSSTLDIVNQWRNNPDNTSAAQQAYELSREFVTGQLNEPTLGASGAIFGCLAAFGYLFPNTYIYLYFFLPLKAKWFVLIYAGFELVMALQNSAGDNVAHFAHLGGAIFGLALVYFWNKNNRKTFY
ncbi:MAG TPA: rhomboid family intramembrane serine protease [Parafilimonas sp.]